MFNLYVSSDTVFGKSMVVFCPLCVADFVKPNAASVVCFFDMLFFHLLKSNSNSVVWNSLRLDIYTTQEQ